MRRPSSAEPDEPDNTAFTELDEALTRAAEDAAGGAERRDLTGGHRTVLLSLVFGLAVLLLSSVIGYAASAIAVTRAEKHTDRRVEVLEKDLQQRREANAAQNAARDGQIAELRLLVCLFADHAQPRDAAVEQVRRRYGCVGVPTPTPVPSPR